MIGPMLLHWDVNMDAYHKFTSHLQAKLADIDQTNLIFGSDEEFAAVKAVNLSFPIISFLFIYISNKVTKEQLHKKMTEKVISTL
jgi:hypothetical protein